MAAKKPTSKVDYLAGAKLASEKRVRSFLDDLDPDVSSQLIEVARGILDGRYTGSVSGIAEAIRANGVPAMNRTKMTWLIDKVRSGVLQ